MLRLPLSGDFHLRPLETGDAEELQALIDANRERLGFTREGTLRQTDRVGERYLDSVVFSMLASEWPAEVR